MVEQRRQGKGPQSGKKSNADYFSSKMTCSLRSDTLLVPARLLRGTGRSPDTETSIFSPFVHHIPYKTLKSLS